MNGNFVKTRDKNVATELQESGFTFLGEAGGIFTFVNDGKVNFSAEERKQKKIVLTDIMSI